MSSVEIDWKILVGQIVNFAILFFILKAFIYKPFLNLLKTRREKIEEGINKSVEADKELSKIGEMKVDLERINEEEKKKVLIRADEEAKKRLEEANKKAEEERSAILAKAQKDAEVLKESEKEVTKKKTIENAFSLAEKLLKENIDEKKGKQIAEDFLSKLKI
ncbi:MAG TPA: F0F1 ATP synthase subunit B [Candidatus Pacearchaeota archaeon]|nr:F0F1 ATP synthase subunit B [Candidatus Pacearchaeota archaeon]HPR79810.1 F0F1 ATP synthase subunit B [Candidatus Pacearchaeota archaeon]